MALFSDNTLAIAYVRKEGGTRSVIFNQDAQLILHWTDEKRILLLPLVCHWKIMCGHRLSEERQSSSGVPDEPWLKEASILIRGGDQ